jgi:3-oxocholest-4-en-26-oyl-CoA dehydrogenase beta subunit
MDFAWTDDQAALRALAREILTERVTNEHLKALEAESNEPGSNEAGSFSVFDRPLWGQLAEAGLTGLAVAEAHGGAGLGFLELSVVLDEVGRTVAPVPAVATLVTAYVLERSAPDTAAPLLAGVVSGETVLTTAFGDQAAGVTARPDGDGWVLDGEKGFVPYGAEADVLVVPAETAEGQAVVAVVRRAAAGMATTELQTTNREPQAAVTFDGVRVEAADVIVDAGELVADLRRHHTAALATVVAGVCAAALEMTARHTATREQFGKPIASFQAVGQRAADAYIDSEMIRLTALQAVWRLSAGWPCDEEVAVAKFWAGDGGMRVVHACQHLHGGLGVDLDYPVHRYFLWCKQIEHELGTPTRQLLELGTLIAATPV